MTEVPIIQANQWAGFYMLETSIMKELRDYYQKPAQKEHAKVLNKP